MKKIAKVSAGLLWALPFMTLAQMHVNPGYVDSLLSAVGNLINNSVIVLVSLAVCYFIWNVIKYAIADQEEDKEKAKSAMIWGVIAIAVIVSVWGLVALLQEVFGVSADKGAEDIGTKLIPK